MAAPCDSQIFFSIFITFLVICCLNLDLSFAHYSPAVFGDHCDHHHHHYHGGESHLVWEKKKLPEELAEEEDLRWLQFGSHHEHEHHHGVLELPGVALWVHAMGCSLLVSLASLICLILLHFIFIKGKPSKAFANALAVFGAGAMLGDAFLHQLPHAFGGEHSHSHDSHADDRHQHDNLGSNHSHAHSLKDLSVGLSVLAGIVYFLLVEKIVRYVEQMSGGVNGSHGHHHHQHKKNENVVNDNDDHDNVKDGIISELPSEERVKRVSDDALQVERQGESAVLRKIGDFGILVRSGFSVSKALFFNFLSSLVALAGTALALLVGQNLGQSSLIEGFTAGGFIYIAIGGVVAEMSNGSSSLRNTTIQITALIIGMGVRSFHFPC